MPVESQLVDLHFGTEEGAGVANGALCVAVIVPPVPPRGSASRTQFFSQYASDDGTSGGAVSLRVDGSVTDQIFFVAASQEFDIRIMRIMVFLEDNAVTHSGFGNLAALSIGVDISMIENGVETFFVEKAKKFADLIEQTLCERPFGATASSFELQSTTGSQDAWVLPFDVGALIPGGARIGFGTQDRFQVRIADNLTGLTKFTVRAVGYKHFA